MSDLFIDERHQQRFNDLVRLDNTDPADIERFTLFYIIAGNEDLSSKAKAIYDFEDNSIRPDCIYDGKVDFCNSSKCLIRLAFNLYNSTHSEGIIDILSPLDTYNRSLAIRGLTVRFIDAQCYLSS